MTIPNFHVSVPAWALFCTMLLDVGLVTFGDPSTFGAPSLATPIFKSVLAMLGVALTVMTVKGEAPPAPGKPEPAPAMP